MDTQQIVVLVVVASAAVYLGRNLVMAARGFFRGKGGCSSGCGKCGFAQPTKTQTHSSPQPNVIALRDIRTLSKKN